ncbi:hypothetical protein GOP47_0009843 [Adiantum capillus-veneris]|uniref:Uncharacterized protein n=1 Tax=Adiantum capillus-veneris TaxID=13818 RepID=A0A9D4UXW0_ADICA|nr:hypothetical protein GOP47_0009843 [Adiantum capillus-veneris]
MGVRRGEASAIGMLPRRGALIGQLLCLCAAKFFHARRLEGLLSCARNLCSFSAWESWRVLDGSHHEGGSGLWSARKVYRVRGLLLLLSPFVPVAACWTECRACKI